MLNHRIHSTQNISAFFLEYLMLGHQVKIFNHCFNIDSYVSFFFSSGSLSLSSKDFSQQIFIIDLTDFSHSASIATWSMGAIIFNLWCNLLPSIMFATSKWTGKNSSIYSTFSSIKLQWRLSLFKYICTKCKFHFTLPLIAK